MSKNIGLFWLKDDFRIKKNLALAEATKNHDKVVVFYLYKNKKFEYQQAQKWWVAKSLDNFKKQLNNFNINLEVVEVSSYKQAFDQLLKKKIFQSIGIRPMNLIILNSMIIYQKL